VIILAVCLLACRLLGCLVALARREMTKDARLLMLRHETAGAALPDQQSPLPADLLRLAALCDWVPGSVVCSR
jgi:hypothetical protein